MVGLLAWGMIHYWGKTRETPLHKAFLYGLFIVLAPLCTLYLNLKVATSGLVPVPNLPVESVQPVLMPFFALPIMLAAGFLGPVGATFIGLLSGLALAIFGSHSIFTPLEMAGVGLFLGMAVGQNYRTWFYKVLRHPLGAAAAISIAVIPIYLWGSFFTIPGSLAERLDFALTQNWFRILARGLELIAAGLVVELIYLIFPSIWPRPHELKPSPAESSLQTRVTATTIPLGIALLIVLIVSDWLVAGSAAHKMIESRLSSTSKIAADGLPYFLEVGQSLVTDMAQPDLLSSSPAIVQEELANRIQTAPFFRQFFVFDSTLNLVAGYPKSDLEQSKLSLDEQTGLGLATEGVMIQTYTIPPASGEKSAQVSFIAAIRDASGEVEGVLLGRTDLESNPFTQPALNALEGVAKDGGEGYILDEDHKVLYQTLDTSALSVADQYVGQVSDVESFYEDVSSTGTRQLVYYQPVVGRPWGILTSMPAQAAQQIALEIAVPMLLILMVLFGLIILFARVGLLSVTRKLHQLSLQASLIAEGQLDSAVEFSGVDEVGRLGKSFEQMRLSLKLRLEEQTKLLEVSQGVASNLNVGDAVQPILRAAQGENAISVRVVLTPGVTMEMNDGQFTTFSIGDAADLFAYLDSQIFELMRSQDVLTISNTARIRRIINTAGKPSPMSLIAFSLRFENNYYGVLWIGFDQPHSYTQDEVRFYSTLANEAALAAANTRLYASAEVGRRRFEAVLNSAPEPVLVFDEKDRLLLLNPAAKQVPGLVSSDNPGAAVREVLLSNDLVEMVALPIEDRVVSREISLSNSRMFQVSVAPVTGEDFQLGKVIVMRDITHYKELDTIKSEFVTTVSHDLRTPLTLMRGYTTMLTMVGDLNEQQKNYINKMVGGIENMTHLVSNLLDLGRIEAGISLNLEEVTLDSIVEKVFKQYYPQAAQKNIQLKFVGLPEGKRINLFADAALLQQALINLVDNAIKYTRSNGEVTVRLLQEEDMVKIEVADSGIGIAPVDLNRLFDRFYRSGRREAFDQRGTGLGLTIVKKIAERHHGKVTVESYLGKGSTFSIEFPMNLTPTVDFAE